MCLIGQMFPPMTETFKSKSNQVKAFWADWNYAKLHLQIMINLYLPGTNFSIYSEQVTVHHSVFQSF